MVTTALYGGRRLALARMHVVGGSVAQLKTYTQSPCNWKVLDKYSVVLIQNKILTRLPIRRRIRRLVQAGHRPDQVAVDEDDLKLPAGLFPGLS
jgi:hypothetical protein